MLELLAQERLFPLYLLSALALAALVYRREAGAFSLRAFVGALFARRLWLHRSARADYAFFLVNRGLTVVLVLPVALAVSLGAAAASERALGAFAWRLEPGAGALALQTLLAALAADFGVFLAHRLQHRIPALWAFHKVHHSAEVLTPVTAFRMHPVDNLLSMPLAALFGGAVVGAFDALQPGNPGPLLALGLNVVVLAFYLGGFNLRHSHVWLSYGPVLSRIFISPAQHQIHHSSAERHLDRNFGLIFAFWDGLFGSLYVPRAKESFDLGLAGGGSAEYHGVRRLLFLPFVELIRRSAPGRSPPRPSPRAAARASAPARR